MGEVNSLLFLNFLVFLLRIIGDQIGVCLLALFLWGFFGFLVFLLVFMLRQGFKVFLRQRGFEDRSFIWYLEDQEQIDCFFFVLYGFCFYLEGGRSFFREFSFWFRVWRTSESWCCCQKVGFYVFEVVVGFGVLMVCDVERRALGGGVFFFIIDRSVEKASGCLLFCCVREEGFRQVVKWVFVSVLRKRFRGWFLIVFKEKYLVSWRRVFEQFGRVLGRLVQGFRVGIRGGERGFN